MKRLLLLIALLNLLWLHSTAQNLVPNPSFEEYDTCPDYISQVNYLKYWQTYRASPDFYNSCSGSSYVSVPNNMTGYQCPANGNSYCGFWVYNSTLNNYREYIGCKLIDSLVINSKYFISAKFNLSNSTNCATNKIGILFTNKPYNYSYPLSFTNQTHLYSQNIVNDTINWVTISGSFISDSAYKYIAIGNFYNDSLTDTLHMSGNTCISYYWLMMFVFKLIH